MQIIEPIALFDLDGTLADHDKAIVRDLETLRAPEEPATEPRYDDDAPAHFTARKRLVRSQPGWWLNLEKLQLGFDVLAVSQRLGFKTHILTKGPWTSENAWTEKYQWVKRHIGPDTDISVTTDKGLSYGNFLVDDYPEYALRWLTFRPRGWVIMPVNCRNTTFEHPQVLKYDGFNLREVELRLTEIMLRVKRKQALAELNGDVMEELRVRCECEPKTAAGFVERHKGQEADSDDEDFLRQLREMK